MALALAASISPAVTASASSVNTNTPWLLVAAEQVVLGLPVALAAAIPLWAATMAGGLIDVLRRDQGGAGLGVVDSHASNFGVLMSLFASVVFLASGGTSRLAAALARSEMPAAPLVAAAHDLTAGIGLAVSIAGPLLGGAVVLEVAFSLMGRGAGAHTLGLVAPLRALGLLALVGVLLERIFALLAIATTSAL
jgi:type III secretory pathway component EscT